MWKFPIKPWFRFGGSHPFIDKIFHEINHPSGVPPFQESSIYVWFIVVYEKKLDTLW